MSTLEKFGILVILILVVIIGVVAVWGVGGDGTNPFPHQDDGSNVSALDPPVAPPGGDSVEWPAVGPAPGVGGGAPVAPPPVSVSPTPPVPAPVAVKETAPSGRTYTVQKGDTLSRISEITLGDRNRWKEILAVNKDKDPRRLKVGDVLNIPEGRGSTVAAKDVTPGVPAPNTLRPVNPSDGPTDSGSSPGGPSPKAGMRQVTVQKGDTFYSLAAKYFGNSNLHYKIMQANPDIDPRKLKPGMTVNIPAE